MPAKKAAKKKQAAGKFGEQMFLFYGSDEAKSKEAALKLSKSIAPKDDEFGLEIVNGTAENSDHATRIISQAIEALQTMPFFGGEKVVWLQGANFFGDTQTGKSETTLRAVEGFLEVLKTGLPGDVKLIISASEMDKRRSFYKQIAKLATLEAHDKIDISKDGWEVKVLSLVRKEAKRLKLNMDDDAMNRFVHTTGAETRVLQSELEKLSLFFGENPVTEKDIVEMVTPTHAGVIFEIGDAICRKNLPRALSLIEVQLRKGESAIAVIRAAIIPQVRRLLHAKDLITRHNLPTHDYQPFQAKLNSLPSSETAHLPRKKDGGINAYPIYLNLSSTRQFSVGELVAALEACREADLRLVTSSLDQKLVLYQLVTKILQSET